jgi:hypothetical protein
VITVASDRVSRSARVAQAIERCIESKSRGDVVTRAELESWFSMVFPSISTRRDHDRANVLFAGLKCDFDRELLTTHRMALQSERGGKWRIVLPSEHAALAADTARQLFTRGLYKAQSIASNVDASQLSDPERVRLDDTSARLASIQMFSRKAMALPSAKSRK